MPTPALPCELGRQNPKISPHLPTITSSRQINIALFEGFSHTEWRTQIEGVWEQGAEENIGT